MDRGPGDNGRKGLKLIILEITSAAVASLVFLDFTIRGSLDLEDPSTGDDLGLGCINVDLFPAVE